MNYSPAILGKETVWNIQEELTLNRLPDFVLELIQNISNGSLIIPPVNREELELERQKYFDPRYQKNSVELEQLKQTIIHQKIEELEENQRQHDQQQQQQHRDQFNQCRTTPLSHFSEFEESQDSQRKRIRCNI
jgi:hypothetical protein